MSKVMRHLKRVLGIGTRIQPIKMDEVTAAKQHPEKVEEAKVSTRDLVGAVIKAERTSWEVRRELANGALNLVVREATNGRKR
jgi:hypothetical protein